MTLTKQCALALLFTLLPAATAGAARERDGHPADTLRLASYNIRTARGLDGAASYDRTAQAIRRLDADVVAVQEIDSATHRSGGRDVLGELAARRQQILRPADLFSDNLWPHPDRKLQYLDTEHPRRQKVPKLVNQHHETQTDKTDDKTHS